MSGPRNLVFRDNARVPSREISHRVETDRRLAYRVDGHFLLARSGRVVRDCRDQKQLSFLLVCRVCGTERLVHRQPYEPRCEPQPTGSSRREATGSAVEQQRNAPDQAATR
jgi:hypothetical protein